MNSSYDLRELQMHQLSVLEELKRVCDLNGIVFYLAYGTCLGAVRHHGFIPWDDDIDVLMYAEDADRLMDHADDFEEPFFLQSTDTDPGFLKTIIRVRKKGTACVEADDASMRCHQGIYVDVYPLYHYPDDKLGRFRSCFDSLFYQLLLSNRPPINHGKLVYQVGKLALSLYKDEGRRARKIDRMKRDLRKPKETGRVADLYGMDISLRRVISYESSWFKEPVYVPFEGRLMPIPTNADAYMRERYGDDYMEVPPLDQQHSYHRYAHVSFDEEFDSSEAESL